MKLDENKVYSLEDLTSEELQYLWIYLTKVDESWTGDIVKIQLFKSKYLYFCFDWKEKGEWLVSSNVDFIKGKQTTNAKELFYTLENVQVDCRELEQKEIDLIEDFYQSEGYISSDISSKITNNYHYISSLVGINTYGFYENDDNCTTITYDKFMELFSEEKQLLPPIVDKAIEVAESIAYKETSNKLNYELDFNFITQLAERMNINKGKYEPYNWQKLDNIEDLKQALYRHVIEVMKGNYEDDNRLFGHLEAIALNAMFN